jgi:ergot alkaloid biosynthesis protein
VSDFQTNQHSSGRILVLGGTGKTGRALCDKLAKADVEMRVASRSPGAETNAVRFDWSDAQTHRPVLRNVDAVYLLAPLQVADPSKQMMDFVRLAIDEGVRRFVLLSSSAVEEGSPGLGTVHAGLRKEAPEWTVLRPSWFMENFLDPAHHHGQSIANKGQIVSATGKGRIGFVAVDDIAAVAFHALTDLHAHNTDYIITGPETLSYDDVAEIFTDLSGRAVQHLAVEPHTAAKYMVNFGISEPFANFLAMLESEAIRNGCEDRVTDSVLKVTGVPPTSLAEFLRARQKASEYQSN